MHRADNKTKDPATPAPVTAEPISPSIFQPVVHKGYELLQRTRRAVIRITAKRVGASERPLRWILVALKVRLFG
jgi:hypothetical protein